MANFEAGALEEFEAKQLTNRQANSLIKGESWWYNLKNDLSLPSSCSVWFVFNFGNIWFNEFPDSKNGGVRPAFLVSSNIAQNLRTKCDSDGLIKFKINVEKDIGSKGTKEVETSVFLEDFTADRTMEIGDRKIKKGEVYTKLIYTDIIHHMAFDNRDYNSSFNYNWQDSDLKKWIEANAVQKLPQDVQDILYERNQNIVEVKDKNFKLKTLEELQKEPFTTFTEAYNKQVVEAVRERMRDELKASARDNKDPKSFDELKKEIADPYFKLVDTKAGQLKKYEETMNKIDSFVSNR